MGLNIQASGSSGRAPVLPQPEDVFLSWLLVQPSGADLAQAAEIEIGKLQRYRGTRAGPQKLLKLFEGLREAVGQGPAIPSTMPQ